MSSGKRPFNGKLVWFKLLLVKGMVMNITGNFLLILK